MAEARVKTTACPCLSCGLNIGKKDKAVGCEFCGKWEHITCANVSEIMYEEMKKVQNLHWFCSKCNSQVIVLLKDVGEVQKRQDMAEEKINVVSDEVNKMRESLLDIKKEIVNINSGLSSVLMGDAAMEEFKHEFETEMKKLKNDLNDQNEQINSKVNDKSSWAEVVKQQVDISLNSVSDNINKVQEQIQNSREDAAEERDKEQRRNNIILYKVPESDESRTEDRTKQDMFFALGMFNNVLNVGSTEDDVLAIYRLGPRGDTSRPLLIKLSSHHNKNMIMESLYKLRNAEAKYKNIVVSHDLTKKERVKCKELVEEARYRTENQTTPGEYVFKVRGQPGKLRIISIRV